MAPCALYTIGHSTHPIEEFLRLLRLHGISALGDVRSQPYSRHNPQFNRETLAASLRAADIAYVDLGQQLGARVEDPACRVDGHVSFDRVARADFFLEGLARVRRGMRQFRLALMCAEADPTTCHRMLLVTRNLRAPDLEILHILADGALETNADAERRLLKTLRMPAASLFQDESETVEEAYERAGRRMTGLED